MPMVWCVLVGVCGKLNEPGKNHVMGWGVGGWGWGMGNANQEPERWGVKGGG